MPDLSTDPETGLPVHLEMPVGADGNGPVYLQDAVEVVCWCGVEGCEKWR